MKSKYIILILTAILSICIMSPTVLVQATPENPLDSPPTEDPDDDPDLDSEANLEKDPEKDSELEPTPEPVEQEDPIVPEQDKIEEAKPDSTPNTKDEQKDKEKEQPKESMPPPKENLKNNNVSKEKAKPTTPNKNSNHQNNSSPSESSWESPSATRNNTSNPVWQESQKNEENQIEEIEVSEVEKTVPVAWTLEEMLSNKAWVSVVDGVYYAIIGEDQQEITEEVAITLGYDPVIEKEVEEPPSDDFIDTFHLAMYYKGLERLPLNDPEYNLELVAELDYIAASEKVEASTVELDVFSKQKLFSFSVLGIATAILIVMYVIKRRRA